jgi:beta-galactosidase/beta-glucuronidase
MKQFHLLVVIFACVFSAQAHDSRSVLFDKDWRFKKDSAIQAESPAYDDAGWSKLDLPHDWSIEDLPAQKTVEVQGSFVKTAVSKGSTGFTAGGVGWYRKTFTNDRSNDGKLTYITFDGMYMNYEVWINGNYLGNRPNGYISYSYYLTPHLNPGGKLNKIAVRVKNLGVNSRWYSGSGIYRHVWLTHVNKVHTTIWCNSITTPDVSPKAALVNLESSIENSSFQNKIVNVQIELLNNSGQVVASKTGKSILATTDRPDAIRLVPDRKAIKAVPNDLSFISVEVVDEKGAVVPFVDDIEISYELTGAGKIAGVGNGNQTDLYSFQQNHKKVYQGKGQVIVPPIKKPGHIT